MMKRTTATTGMVLAAAMLLAGGCDNAGQISGRSATLPSSEHSAAFFDRVSSEQEVTENDAMRGILMLLEGDDTADSFGQRVQTLQSKNIVSANWDFDADRPINRGRFAYMIYQAIGMDGGVILTLTGPSPRYCLRELNYRGVMTQGNQFGTISGMEYVGILGRADTYKRTGTVPNLAGTIDD